MPRDGVEFVEGSDGFLAYLVKSDADIKSPHRMYLPEKLEEFAIMLTIRPENTKGGYIFTVVNPLDTIVQLGLHLSPVIRDKCNLTLYYTDPGQAASQKLVSFELPFAKKFIRMGLMVLKDKVIYFHNCIESSTKSVVREPEVLYFDSASTLYLAQAGPILKGNLEVSGLFFFYIFLTTNCVFFTIWWVRVFILIKILLYFY